MLGESLRRRRCGTARGGRRSGDTGAGGSRSRSTLRLFVIGGAAALAGFGAGYTCAVTFLLPGGEAPEVLATVPSLTRLPVEAAAELLAGSGLALGEIDTLTHPSISAGAIVAQHPLPGQLALPGDSVRVTISGGPDLREVPDVRRMAQRDAETILRASGFTVRAETVYADAEPGRVVGVEPAPGTELALPHDVRMDVSRGPARIELPLLLALPVERATAILDSLGFVVSDVERRPWAGAAPGTVIGQEPAAGTVLDRGSAVRLVVVGEPPETRNFRRRDP